MKRIRFKSDSYRKTRGGYSRLLEISCSECGHKILLYQKDGAGPLKRLYLDRILSSKGFSQLQLVSLKHIPHLVCPKCRQILGTPYLYPKEKRKAFRLFVGALKKKIKKAH